MTRTAMAATREGRDPFSVVAAGKSESRMNEVRRLLDKFEKEQTELYLTRSTAASRHSFVSMTGVDLLCILVAALMIAAHLYSFFLCRRQLKKVESADIRIQSVIDQILDGMITIDEKGKVYSMNPAAKQMFGYGESEPIATEFAELIPTIFLEGLESPIPLEKTHLAERTGNLVNPKLGETAGWLQVAVKSIEQRVYSDGRVALAIHAEAQAIAPDGAASPPSQHFVLIPPKDYYSLAWGGHAVEEEQEAGWAWRWRDESWSFTKAASPSSARVPKGRRS